MATILFLHGWNSRPGGLKPTYLAEHGHTVINPALPDETSRSRSGSLRPKSTGTTPTSWWARHEAVPSP